MEITKEQWDEIVNKVNGFETKIEELKSQNATLTTKNSELETKSSEYETKLKEWQTKLNDQQATIDSLAKNKPEEGTGSKPPVGSKSGHKSVRFDPVQDKYIFE
mgnify:CR=1 FL=1